jgi:plastocyanin
MRRLTPVVLSCLFLAAVGCGGVSGPQTYSVGVDAASPEGKNFQYSAFFPSTIKVSPGDSITFENRSTQAPHTVSFGVAADRSNQPPVFLPTGVENPVVQEPCFSEDPPTAQLTQCPHKELPAYGGTGYWNSGFLAPAPAPAQAGPKKITLRIDGSAAPGQYSFLCILHGPMAGVIEVVKEEGERESRDAVVELGNDQLVKVRRDANAVAEPELAKTPDAVKVAAGWGNGTTAINRFYPEIISVKPGTTVSWESFSAFEPHTVSFGANYHSGAPGPGQLAPQGGKAGSDYTGGDANSGVFGKAGGPFPAGPFTLKFPTAGEYKFVCVLHPGMEGTVKVS